MHPFIYSWAINKSVGYEYLTNRILYICLCAKKQKQKSKSFTALKKNTFRYVFEVYWGCLLHQTLQCLGDASSLVLRAWSLDLVFAGLVTLSAWMITAFASSCFMEKLLLVNVARERQVWDLRTSQKVFEGYCHFCGKLGRNGFKQTWLEGHHLLFRKLESYRIKLQQIKRTTRKSESGYYNNEIRSKEYYTFDSCGRISL